MQILLSPVTSANVWIQSRKVEARKNARAEGCAVFESQDGECVVPEMSKLLKAKGRPIKSLAFSASDDELNALQPKLGFDQLSLAVNAAGMRHGKSNYKWVLVPQFAKEQVAFPLCKGVYICSPAVSFMAVAKHMSRPQLVQLLTELCGKYALDPCIQQGFFRCGPLFNRAELEGFLRDVEHAAGSARVRGALPFVAEGSESPRETAMQLALSLPHTDGGMKLPLGIFGHKVALGNAARKIYGRRSCRCDLYFPDAKLDFEYESDLEHSGEQARKKDARREAALALEGVEVIPVTSQEMESIAHMNVLAQLLASRLGLRVRVRVRDFPMRQLELFDALLSRCDWCFSN